MDPALTVCLWQAMPLIEEVSDAARTARILLYLDHILRDSAVIFAIVVFAVWITRSRRDPLRNAPPRPNWLREDALFLAMFAYMAAYLVVASLLGIDGEEDPSVASSLPAAGAAQITGIITCVILGARRFRGGAGGFLCGFQRTPFWPTIGCGLGILVLTLGLCPLVLETTVDIVRRFDPAPEFPMHSTIEALRDPTQSATVVAALWVAAVILAPAAEELFFRGILHTVLLNLRCRRWIVIGGASAAFAAVHVGQPHAMPALAALGVLLGFAYERTGSLLPPIAIHAVFNLKTLVWEALHSAAG